MELMPDIGLQARFRKWSVYLAAVVIAVGLAVLAGWQFDIERLRQPSSQAVAMNPLTAISLILTAISIILLSTHLNKKQARVIGYGLAVLVLLVGLINLSGYGFGLNLEIDKVLYRRKLEHNLFNNKGNSMAPNTSVGFVLTGIALLLLHIRTSWKAQIIAILIGLLGWFSILGYIYQVRSFYGMLEQIPMAIHTASCFLCLAMAILFAIPESGLMKQVTSTYGGSIAARVLLPAAIILPSILGFLRLYGDWLDIYSSEFGVTIYTVSLIVIFLGLIWYSVSVLNRRDVLKKEAEKALTESEEQVSAIFSGAPDAVIVIDDHGMIVKWNPEAEKLFGWTAAEITGKMLSETIIPPQYRDAHNKGIEKHIRTGEAAIIGKTIELQGLKKDNTQFEIALRVAPVIIRNTEMFVGFIRDITQEKMMDQKLKSFNESLSHQVEEKTKEVTEILDRLTDGFIGIDKNFNYTYLNKRAGEMIRREPAAMIGKNMWEEFPEAVGSATYDAFQKAMKEQVFVSNTDYYPPLNLWQENNIYPSPQGLSVFLKDISSKMQAELAAREKEERYKTFVNEAIDAVFVIAVHESKFIEVNTRAGELFGYSLEEFLRMGPGDLLFPDDKMISYERKLNAGESVRVEGYMRKKDGTGIYVETSTRRLADGNHLSFVRDITQRKNSEKELIRLTEELRKLTDYLQKVREEERTHIAREIHDELGQQLTVLKMDFAWVAKKVDQSNDQINQKFKELLSMIDTTVKTVRRISSELRPSLLDDLGLVPAMEWHLDEFERRSGIKKNFTSLETISHLTDDIKIALFRIFQESLTNVARHSEATGIFVSLEQNNHSIILTITDNGKGYDKENSSKKTLGILGMKERTLMLGGDYTISGLPGKGTTVRVTIPYKHTNQ